jgi:hypothetical protein
MKSVFLLLPFLLCAVQFCKGQQIDAEHQKKAAEIIQRLSSNEPLPAQIHSPVISQMSPHLYSYRHPSHHHSYSYLTQRMDSNIKIDSVQMNIMANDSINDLIFEERYFKHGILKGYNYNIKNGELTRAYNGDNDHTLWIEKEDTLWIYGMESEKHKEPDWRSFAFYQPKLLKSIDELYDMLFKK